MVSGLAIRQDSLIQSAGHRHGCGRRGRLAFDTIGHQEALEMSCPRGTAGGWPRSGGPSVEE